MEKLLKELDAVAILTAEEIQTMDVIIDDQRAIKETLKIALQYHANVNSQNETERRKIWQGWKDKYGLDHEKTYVMNRVKGYMVLQIQAVHNGI
ncbi:hypothetical protein LCGC14_1581460 [marine sediment metagenome]|uniref:Uncharacterized protein n=1 Tax=marine sediment metagenome TaxID=412755 RepID=A0A0F9IGX6_9ZZZZ